MFTGIIDHCGIIKKLDKQEHSISIAVQSQFSQLQLGESIAVDGICLTVTRTQADLFYCEISPETLKLTGAQYLTLGQEVNLERALRLSDRLGGHFVMGHVDCIAYVATRQTIGDFIEFWFSGLAQTQQPWIAEKACIAINGISLTVNAVKDDGFSVMVVPHTLHCTNLNRLKLNDPVNIEFDYIARFIVNRDARLRPGPQ